MKSRKIILLLVFMLTALSAYSISVSIEYPGLRFVFIGHPAYWSEWGGDILFVGGRSMDQGSLFIPAGAGITVEDTDYSFHHPPGTMYLDSFLGAVIRFPLAYTPGGRTVLTSGSYFFQEQFQSFAAGVGQTVEYQQFEVSGFIGGILHRYEDTYLFTDEGKDIVIQGRNYGTSVQGRMYSWSAPALWWGGDISLRLTDRLRMNAMVTRFSHSTFDSAALYIGSRRIARDNFSDPMEVTASFLFSFGMSLRL